jgi:hypothetical protein
MRFVPTLIALLLTACVARQPVTIQSRFDPAEYRSAQNATGSARITGQAFLRQQGGGVVTCAGEKVMLIPATAYANEVFNTIRAGGMPDLQGRKISDAVAKETVCDAQGNFAFERLPARDWYLVTQVKWMVRDLPQGGFLARRVSSSVQGGSPMLLSDADRM